MTTSGVTNTEFPADFIIQEAYERTGQDPETLSQWQLQSAMNSVNLMFMHWQNQNVLEWNMDQRHEVLTQGAAFIDTPQDTVAVLSAFVRRAGVDTVINPIGRETYDAITNKDSQGLPDRYWTYRTAGAPPRIFLWQCSSAVDDEIFYWRIKRTDDLTSLAETLDTVDRWLETCCAELAVRIWEKLPFDLMTKLGPSYNNKTLELTTKRNDALYFAQTEDRTKASTFALPSDYAGSF